MERDGWTAKPDGAEELRGSKRASEWRETKKRKKKKAVAFGEATNSGR